MSQLCPKICYQEKDEGLMLTACYGVDRQVYLPDEIHGKPIISIAPYAFSDREPSAEDLCWVNEEAKSFLELHRLKKEEITEVRLPVGVREIGRYAFYRCRNLRKLILSDSLREIGGGALTGCRIREVELWFLKGEQSALPSILDEMRYSILARLYYQGDKMAQVLFPEHYEEAVENTPARILYTSHHGAGGYYRQCFYDRVLDYQKYDALLPRAVAEEAEETVLRLVFGRLKHPYRLSEKAADSYGDYLTEHLEAAAQMLVADEDMEGLRLLSEKDLWTRQSLNAALDKAAELKKTEVIAFLAEEKSSGFRAAKKSFEL